MGLEITHLGSGSRGNATLLSTGETRVIVDCGFSLKQMEARLAMVGVEGSSVNAIVVSHHHSDHSKSAARASKKWGARLYANLETTMRLGLEPISEVRTFEGLERLHIADDLSLLPVPVPHDDADNGGIIASNGDGRRAAIVTDLGEPTLELMKHLSGCEHISIEANYDLGRLISGPYPPSLKRRISGRGGHLSNEQTADILTEVLHPGLQALFFAICPRKTMLHIWQNQKFCTKLVSASMVCSQFVGKKVPNFPIGSVKASLSALVIRLDLGF